MQLQNMELHKKQRVTIVSAITFQKVSATAAVYRRLTQNLRCSYLWQKLTASSR